jgi:hypothetical protein
MRRFGFVLALLVGCGGTASVYYQDQHGGVLALHNDEEKALKDAEQKMAAHCGAQGYQIVKRETVVVGQENYAQSQHSYGQDQQGQHAQDTHSQQASQGSSAQTATTDSHTEQGVNIDRDGWDGGSDSTTTQTASGASQQSSVSDTSTRGADQTQIRGGDQSSSVSGTRDVTEMRVTYVCGNSGGAGGAPAAAH